MSKVAENVNDQQMHETKREEFRKYLEQKGVIDTLGDLLLSIYMQYLNEKGAKPEDPVEYVRNFFAETCQREKTAEVKKLKKELADAKSKIKELRKKLNKYESNKQKPAK